MKPVHPFALLLGLISAASLGSTAESAPRKPNVLFIAVDDMNCDLNAFGNPLVKSPSIDRLAARGTTFTRAYCQYPLCNPTRSSLMTGLRPDTTRVFNLSFHFRQELPNVVTLPQLFMRNGYYSARVGKIYHYGEPNDLGTNGLDDRASWNERFNPAGRDKTTLEEDVINYTPGKPGGLATAMALYADPTGTDAEHTDGKVAEQAIKLLEAHKDQPFFIAAGFYRPHCPWITPKKYFDMYSADKIPFPKITPETKNDYPAAALSASNPWPWQGVTEQQARECKLAYYASISFVDAQIGLLLDAVDRLGLSDNTIIVFWSDHGFMLGEHGLWFKTCLFEEAAKAPLIVVLPGNEGAGRRCERIVEYVDIYPTVAELAGLKGPAELEGVSLRPLLDSPKAAWLRPAYTQVERNISFGEGPGVGRGGRGGGGEQRPEFPGLSVRTERWRYTEWNYGQDGVELYDEQDDPHELKNLAADPQFAEVVKEHKALLKARHPAPVKAGIAQPDTREKWVN